MIHSVIGLDPGPTTGMCFLNYSQLPDGTWNPVPEALMCQVDGKSSPILLRAMLSTYYSGDCPVAFRHASVERFVTGRSAGTRGSNADVTRQLVMELAEVLQGFAYHVQLRSAADVKPWATDKRLIRAGIAKAENAGIHGKLRDGYDAARHALYCAIWDARLKDPLLTRKAAA